MFLGGQENGDSSYFVSGLPSVGDCATHGAYKFFPARSRFYGDIRRPTTAAVAMVEKTLFVLF